MKSFLFPLFRTLGLELVGWWVGSASIFGVDRSVYSRFSLPFIPLSLYKDVDSRTKSSVFSFLWNPSLVGSFCFLTFCFLTFRSLFCLFGIHCLLDPVTGFWLLFWIELSCFDNLDRCFSLFLSNPCLVCCYLITVSMIVVCRVADHVLGFWF